MHYTLYTLLLLVFTPHTLHPATFTQRCINSCKSLLNRYSAEKVDFKELSTASIETISINNLNGSITIKTGWKKNYLCLKTTKRARNKKLLDTLTITARKTEPLHLCIETHTSPQSASASVEYELIIPASLNVNLTTHSGNIYVNDIKGSITAHTHRGDITITNASHPIYAHSTHSGSILVEHSTNTIHTQTTAGNIVIVDACDSVTAHAKKGKVTVAYKQLPATSSIDLETLSGNISLELPTDIHATINGSTTHGTIISEHFITMKPYTTRLNAVAWNKMKKELHGTIGSGDASISFASLYGNVKILETKAT